MKLRKIFAAAAASAVAASALAAVSYAADATGTPGETAICYADSAWASQYWLNGEEQVSKGTNAIITGDGTYTVAIEAYTKVTDEETGEESVEEGANGLAFAAIEVVDGENLFPGMVLTIDSVKIDGAEVALNGTPFTSSDEKITTRVNLFNEWVPAPPDDARTIDGLADDATAQAVSNDIGEWKTMEVTFTVSGASAAAPAEEATEAPATGDVDAATDSSKGSPDTGIADVAAVAGIAILAGGAFMIAKKRK